MAEKTKLDMRVLLTIRDRAFLQALYAFDGVLSSRQVRKYFYPGIRDSTFWNRMRRLEQARYIAKPTRRERYVHPVPETVYWLGPPGIAFVAAQQGIHEDASRIKTDNAKKRLAKQLRKQGIFYKPWPDWLRLKHQIAVNEIRFIVEAAAQESGLSFDLWIPESYWRADPVKVSYMFDRRTHDGQKVVEKTATVIPDGFFAVSRSVGGGPLAYLVEVDMRTEHNPRVVREKIRPGLAFLASELYQRRTGLRYGRWLICTTGSKRVENMKIAAEQATNRPWFYFSSFDQLSPETFFNQPIWSVIGKDEPVALLDPI